MLDVQIQAAEKLEEELHELAGRLQKAMEDMAVLQSSAQAEAGERSQADQLQQASIPSPCKFFSGFGRVFEVSVKHERTWKHTLHSCQNRGLMNKICHYLSLG